MKKATKALIGTAAGSAALLGTFCTACYECMLNIRLAAKIGERMSPPPEAPAPAPEETAGTEKFNREVNEFVRDVKAEDIYITNKKGQTRHLMLIDNGHPEKWAVIFHGFTSAPGGMLHYAYAYTKMGFNCILPSMRGHGNDENRYCSMGYHDKAIGIDAIQYIVDMYPGAEIVLHGESMGAATTMLITGELLPLNVKCAISDCGFTRVIDEYRHVTRKDISPMMLPMLPVLSFYSERVRKNFNFTKCAPIEAVKKSVTPTLFVHGEADDFVPFSMMNEVYTACSAEKDFFTVKSAAHAESVSKEPERYWTNVHNFIKKYIAL